MNERPTVLMFFAFPCEAKASSAGRKVNTTSASSPAAIRFFTPKTES
jgi:hypothetical protein